MLYVALKATKRSTLLAQTEVQLKVLSMLVIEDLDEDEEDTGLEEEEEADGGTESLNVTETERSAPGMRDSASAGDLRNRDASDDVPIAGTTRAAKSLEETAEITREKLTIETHAQAAGITTQYGPMITVELQRAPVPRPEAEVDVAGADQAVPVVVDVVVADAAPLTTGTATTTSTMTTALDRGVAVETTTTEEIPTMMEMIEVTGEIEVIEEWTETT